MALSSRCQAPQLSASRARAPVRRRAVQCNAIMGTSQCLVTLSSSGRSDTQVQPHPEGDLAAYVQQSPAFLSTMQMPMGGALRALCLEKGLFELTVPRIQLFDLWIQPRAEALLRVEKLPCGSSRLAVTATKCKLLGSQHVEQFKLNERFKLDVNIHFVSDQPKGPGTPGAIRAKGDIGVKVDIPPPFSFMPQQVLQTTGNTALNTTVSILLNSIVASMAKDYARWVRMRQEQQQLQQPALATIPVTSSHN